MNIVHYPDENTVKRAKASNDPILVLIAFDEAEVLSANIDDALEHSILLKKCDRREGDIDKYFRIVLNHDGADWTFVCPSNYKNITDRDKRIETFYNDGITAISKAVRLLGYSVSINIPERYRRHFKSLSVE